MNAPIRSDIPFDQSAMLSPVHKMLATIRQGRADDVARANEIVNDPAVLPTIKAHLTPPLDMAGILSEPVNILLLGEHGLMFFTPVEGTSIYDAHTAVLTGGRGEWALTFVQACLHWIFTRTSAVEIVTRCPHIENHKATVAICHAVAATLEGTIADGYPHNGVTVPADVYSLRLIDWLRTAPGLVERGRWFHTKLEAEYRRLGRTGISHKDEDVHDRHVGACAEMLFVGNVGRALGCYNRFARICDYAEIKVLTVSPLVIDIHESFLMVRDDDFYVYALNDTWQGGH